MKSPVVKRSIIIAGHKTSVSLEDAFWKGLKDIAGHRDITLSNLVAEIDSDRRHGNLSSAIRLFVLNHYRAQTDAAAEPNNGHGIGGGRDLMSQRGASSVLRAE
jgi:predicted DNA-binding ribbon-helix-helix protein